MRQKAKKDGEQFPSSFAAPRAPTAAERATSAASKRGKGKSKVWSKLAGLRRPENALRGFTNFSVKPVSIFFLVGY